MASVPEQLRSAAKKVYGPEQTRPVKMRTFLAWFGAKRRGVQVALEISAALKEVMLVTEPDFMTANIEDRIRLKPPKPLSAKLLADLQKGTEEVQKLRAAAATKPKAEDPVTAPVLIGDPTPRVGTIFGGVPPVSVKPDDSVRQATTKMFHNEFSQLPVMSDTRKVHGIVSWKSIGEAIHLHKKDCKLVKDCMEKDVEILPADTHLWKAIKTIAEHDVVLVRGTNNEIVGLVTTFDLATRYHSLAEPFLLLSEIENNLRQLITLANFPLALLVGIKDEKDTSRRVTGVSKLTFGECVRLLEKPDNWRNITKNLSRVTFIKEMDAVRKIRNDVTHFSPDPLDDEELKTLRRAAQMMRKLKLFEK